MQMTPSRLSPTRLFWLLAMGLLVVLLLSVFVG